MGTTEADDGWREGTMDLARRHRSNDGGSGWVAAGVTGRTARTAGVAALLPALFLAALYVAAPFAGTTTHAIAHHAPVVDAAAPAGDQAGAAERPLAACAVSARLAPTAC
jgi:hypothetical protein